MRPHLLFVLAAVLSLAGCGKPQPADPRAKPGFLIGRIADAAGKPLKNVTVSISGFTSNNEPVTRSVALEAPASEYAIQLPDGMYNTPVARITVEYDNRTYVLPLAPADNEREWLESRDSRRGMVRDFIWKIQGLKPGATETTLQPGDYYGGTIIFGKQGDFGDYAKFEITLAPDGPLIDGSAGKPLKFSRAYPWSRHEDQLLLDVPIGRYIATVKHLFGARPKPLKAICYTIDPQNLASTPEKAETKVPVHFEMRQTGDGAYELLSPNLVVFPP